MLMLAYAFFKFGWAYRLFNYTTIVMGSIPDELGSDNKEALQTATTAAQLATLRAVISVPVSSHYFLQ